MSAQVILWDEARIARGLLPVATLEVFGPPPGKRIGDTVTLPDGSEGLVISWRPAPGHAPTLFIRCAAMTFCLAADRVSARDATEA